MATLVWFLAAVVHAVVVVFLGSSSRQEAHAWMLSSTAMVQPAMLKHHLKHHHRHQRKQQQHRFRIQPHLSSTTSSFDASSGSSSSSTSSSDPPSVSTTSSSSSSSSSLSPPPPLEYNWKEQWYALTYASYVPHPSQSAEVVPAAVFGQPLVLWRETDADDDNNNNNDSSSTIYCATDACPHRSTALSEGRVRNGTLTCLYHGWQFSGRLDGQCVRIPQLAVNASIPKRACLDMKTCRVQDGIVWVWMGDNNGTPPTRDVPTTGTEGVFDQQGQALGDWLTYDFQ
jgi:nitrite reductase/ring-hydroxylating ferredoxin subunit